LIVRPSPIEIPAGFPRLSTFRVRQPRAWRPIAVLTIFAWFSGVSLGDEPPTYERDIKPLFAKRCVACHNQKKVQNVDVSGGLALDSFEAVTAGTTSRKVVVPGNAVESELIARLNASDEDERMPLFEKPLPEAQRQLVERWVAAGAARGTPTALPEAPVAPPRRRMIRSLDVTFPATSVAPAKSEGFGAGGPIQLAIKIGPLPAISALGFRGDGRQLAVGTHDTVVVWDLADARPALILRDLPGAVHALAFSRDGRQLAVGAGLTARSGVVRLYSVPDGTLLHDFPGHDDVVYGLAFRPDGAQLASASFDQTVRVWDLALGRPAGVFTGHSDFVYDVAYTRDGKSLLTVSKDRTIKRIALATMKETRTYSGYNEDVLTVAVQPHGERFVSAGHEPQVRWWTLDAESPVMQVAGHSGPVHQAAFSGDGTRLITVGGDSSVRVWDGHSGAFQRVLPGPTEWQYAAALSSNGKVAAAGGWDGIVRVWDADTGALRASLVQTPADDPARVDWLALAPTGYFAASPSLSALIRWRVGGSEVPSDGPRSLFSKAEHVGRSLQGQPVPAPGFQKPK
jgi:hypothetical protein